MERDHLQETRQGLPKTGPSQRHPFLWARGAGHSLPLLWGPRAHRGWAACLGGGHGWGQRLRHNLWTPGPTSAQVPLSPPGRLTSGAAPGRSCEEGLLARSDPSSSLPASSDEAPWSLTRQVSSSSFLLRVSSSLSASVGSRPARHCSGQGDPRSAGHPWAPGRRGALGGVRGHCPEELARRARAGPVPGSGARLCRGGGGGTPADPDAPRPRPTHGERDTERSFVDTSTTNSSSL